MPGGAKKSINIILDDWKKRNLRDTSDESNTDETPANTSGGFGSDMDVDDDKPPSAFPPGLPPAGVPPPGGAGLRMPPPPSSGAPPGGMLSRPGLGGPPGDLLGLPGMFTLGSYFRKVMMLNVINI